MAKINNATKIEDSPSTEDWRVGRSEHHRAFHNAELSSLDFLITEIARIKRTESNDSPFPNGKKVSDFIQDLIEEKLASVANQVFKGEINIKVRF